MLTPRFRAIIASIVSLTAAAMLGAAETTVRLTFSKLAGTPMTTEVGEWPAEIRALDNQPVRLTGYLLPLVVERGFTREFLLMRSQNTCCFGKAATPNEFVVVRADAPGIAVVMDVPVTLRGTFRVAPAGPAGAPPLQMFGIESAVRL